MKGMADSMKLFQNFIKLTIAGNIKNYGKAAGSIIITIILLALSNNLIWQIRSDNIILTNYKYSSIQMSLSVLGGIFVINQYYRTMKGNIKNYGIIKTMGASRNQMRLLIYLQTFLLFIITVPVGIFAGISISNIILKALSENQFRNHHYNGLESSAGILIISGAISCTILAFGVITEIGVKKKLPAQMKIE